MIMRPLPRIDDRCTGIDAHAIGTHYVTGAAVSELLDLAVDRHVKPGGIFVTTFGEVNGPQLLEDHLPQANGGDKPLSCIVRNIVRNPRAWQTQTIGERRQRDPI